MGKIRVMIRVRGRLSVWVKGSARDKCTVKVKFRFKVRGKFRGG